ncbi:MAG: TusE/DsrC/DsvC family sulfur relay protein [Myxococcales bacterium]|nr:TusE/DsrC/DsvC family sulfur relay protein [Myxococcales bacterium]
MTELQTITARLDALTAQVEFLVERERRRAELYDELVPIGRVAMTAAIARLDRLEQDGTLAFVRELGGIGQRVVEHFSAADVRQLGEAVVVILETVRSLTQPDVLRVAADAGDAIHSAEATKPLGLFGMMRATKDEDVQRGMAVMMEVLRRVGHGVNAMAAKQQQTDDKQAKLAEILGPRRKNRALGTERTAPPRALPSPPTVRPAPAAPACAAPSSKPAVAAGVVDGVEVTADGNLVDAAAWTRALAAAIASAERVALTDAHWAVIDAARADFAATGASPNIRRLTQVASVTTKDLYTLFPRAPGRTIAKVAGLPKPAGCL